MKLNKHTLYSDDLLNILPEGVLVLNSGGEVLLLNQQARMELQTKVLDNNTFKSCHIDGLLKLLYNKEDILPTIMDKLRQGESRYALPDRTFLQEKVNYTQFPIKGQFETLQEKGEIKVIVFFFRNITAELTQEYILNTALQRTKIYPWYYDISKGEFTLDYRYFKHLGIPAGVNNTLSMEEYINMIHPDDREALTNAFVVQLSGIETYERPVPFRLHRGDGTWEWFEGQSTYIANVSGQPYRLVGICMSIQEYKDVEETLITARKKAEESDKLKMAFLANMSHEIRTPLNAIVGFSDVIGNSYNELSKEEIEDFIRLISINSEHLTRLIDDILDLSKIESNTIDFSFSSHSLKSLLTDIEKEQVMKNISEIEIKAILPDDDTIIVTDARRLKQVICNLINNACKFTEEGFIHFGFTTGKETVSLFVEDTGIGIPDEHQEQIFGRFYKVNSFKQGTGLGLSICKTIIDHLNGKITVTSELGKGSCFTITLPLNKENNL